MSALSEAALAYAGRGWHVFPLAPGGKLPLIPKDEERAIGRGWEKAGHGCKDATTDLATISGWWRRCPRANVGVATGANSGLFVVDLDGPDAAEDFKRKFTVGSPAVQRTMRGWHLCYSWVADCEGVSISAGMLGAGIDTRGEGGYIVVEPSRRDDGGRYSWTTDLNPGPPPAELIAACKAPRPAKRRSSAALFDRVDKLASRYGDAALERVCAEVSSAGPGKQETTLFWGAKQIGQLIAGGEIGASYGARMLLAAAGCMRSYDPHAPWHSGDIEEKIARGIERGRASPRRAGRAHV